jgi:hypothetical protein
MSLTNTAPRPTRQASNSFRSVLWAEWVKLRTVRGWTIAHPRRGSHVRLLLPGRKRPHNHRS